MFQSDIFVFDDDVQYSRTGLHNSNYIRVGDQKFRIIIPCSYPHGALINQVEINYEKPWMDKLLKTVWMNYKNARYFEETFEMLERNLIVKHRFLANLNLSLLMEISRRFGLSCRIVIASRDVPTQLKKNERNVYQCEQLGGTVYYSGTGGKEYNDEEMYEGNGIKVMYSDYKPVQYRQCKREGFIEDLSVLDYIFNQGFNLPEEWVKQRYE
ncbi:MAG: WbqC family protein [Lachnospiraceae bacterium]|nr:WbqC family protein [Lachnospiraceae bacterium]